jgi:hypothetical protein
MTPVLALVLLALETVPRESCFPIELLPAGERPQAEELFLKLMDSEALYTVIGGVKPMSSGFVSFRLPASSLDAEKIDRARRHLALFRCGEELLATVHHFVRLYPDKDSQSMERYFEGVVFHRGALRRAIREHKSFFYPEGLTENSNPLEVLMTIDFLEGPARLRGLGYLFGYPNFAVDFFASAAKEQTLTGKFVERDFFSHPTFAHAERGVVYAVPKGHAEREEDRAFRAALSKVFEDYKQRRERFIGEGKPGVVAMLREWFCREAVCAVP